MTVGAVILCGGESRRMGQSKAWLPFGEELMLQRIVRLVSSVTGSLVVVAAPEQPLPPLSPAVRIARDPVLGRGPLQGLAAGLQALPKEVTFCYATGTDVPFLEPSWVHRLLALIGDHDLAIPVCEGRLHPLAALYRRETSLPAIESLLKADRLRPIFLMETLRTREVRAEELVAIDPALGTLRNLNTPEDYHSALNDAGLCTTTAVEPLMDHTGSRLPRIQIELFGVPRQRAGVSRLWVEAADLGSALRSLTKTCPSLIGAVLSDEGRLQPAYTVNLNGRRFINDPQTPLTHGDSLILLALDVGG
jgi:molybdopterin-guanine dinucleotide biosynthesis protein A